LTGRTVSLGFFRCIELALHRALRGEVPPSVRAISARISYDHVTLSLYCYRRDFEKELFEETVISELEQVIPAGHEAPTRVTFQYRPAREFAPRPPDRVLVSNPWAE
jgi:hypothetical protein